MPGILKYVCPVCGFPDLTEPPTDFNICPSCGTEFDYNDFAVDPDDLRKEWIRNGGLWFAGHEWPKPPRWNPFIQLVNAGLATAFLSADAGLTIEKSEIQGQPLPLAQQRLISTSGRTLAKAA